MCACSLRRLPRKGALGVCVLSGKGSIFDLLSQNCSVASGAEAQCSGLLDKYIYFGLVALV